MTRRARLSLSLVLVLGGLLGGAWWWRWLEAAPVEHGSATSASPAESSFAAEPLPPTSREVPLALTASASDGGVAVLEVVSAEDGRPLPGARVAVRPAGSATYRHHGPRGFSGETDARGRVEVPPQPGEDLRLFIACDYFVHYLGPFVPDTQVALQPLPPVPGRVLSASRTPVAGALVTAVRQRDVQTHTGADGTFSLRLPRLDRLLAEHQGEVAVTPFLEVEPVLARQPLELVLGIAPLEEGVVRGRDGQPLADVAVTASVQAATWRQTTGRDGVFRVPAPGVTGALRSDDLRLGGDLTAMVVPVHLVFEKRDYVTVELPEFPRLVPEVVLSRPAHIEGLLVDRQGSPLGGVTVGLLDTVARFAMAEAVTDAEGRFTFRDRDEPEVFLEALIEREEGGEQTELRVALPEGETTRVTLALRPELQEVPLTYLSSAGVEVAGCRTVAAPVPAAGWSIVTGFSETIELRRGRFHFEVRCDDGRGADETLEVDPRPEMPPLRFVVRSDAGETFDDEKPPELVLVKAVTPEGAPVEGAEVECYTARGVTGPDGRFRCEVRAGDGLWPIHVHASKGDARGLARATGREAEVQVVLRSRVTLRGRIDGALPAGKLVLIVRSAAENGQEPLVGNSFALEGRAAIRTFVCVERIDEANQRSQTLGCAVSEAGEELVIRLGAPGKLTFSSLDRAGAPLADPIVYVDRANQLVESPNGLVSLELAPGEHVLVLNVDGSRARYETRFTVRPREVTALGGLRLE